MAGLECGIESFSLAKKREDILNLVPSSQNSNCIRSVLTFYLFERGRGTFWFYHYTTETISSMNSNVRKQKSRHNWLKFFLKYHSFIFSWCLSYSKGLPTCEKQRFFVSWKDNNLLQKLCKPNMRMAGSSLAKKNSDLWRNWYLKEEGISKRDFPGRDTILTNHWFVMFDRYG